MCHSTFEHLDELLSEVCEGLDGSTDWPPPYEKECMAVAGLNLLNLQVPCAVYSNIIIMFSCDDAHFPWQLVNSLKSC